MNDFARGAIEALAWTKTVLEEASSVRQVKRQLEEVLSDLLKGSVADFPTRVKIY